MKDIYAYSISKPSASYEHSEKHWHLGVSQSNHSILLTEQPHWSKWVNDLLEGIFTVVVEGEVKVKDDRPVAADGITGGVQSRSNFLHTVPEII